MLGWSSRPGIWTHERPGVNSAACGSGTCSDQAIIVMSSSIVRLQFSDQHHGAFAMRKVVAVFFES